MAVDARTGETVWCTFDITRNAKNHIKGYRVRLRDFGDGVAEFTARGIGKGEKLKWWRLVPDGWEPEQAAADLRQDYGCGTEALSPSLPNQTTRKRAVKVDPRQNKLF